jgi:hypothetical protein
MQNEKSRGNEKENATVKKKKKKKMIMRMNSSTAAPTNRNHICNTDRVVVDNFSLKHFGFFFDSFLLRVEFQMIQATRNV